MAQKPVWGMVLMRGDGSPDNPRRAADYPALIDLTVKLYLGGAMCMTNDGAGGVVNTKYRDDPENNTVPTVVKDLGFVGVMYSMRSEEWIAHAEELTGLTFLNTEEDFIAQCRLERTNLIANIRALGFTVPTTGRVARFRQYLTNLATDKTVHSEMKNHYAMGLVGLGRSEAVPPSWFLDANETGIPGGLDEARLLEVYEDYQTSPINSPIRILHMLLHLAMLDTVVQAYG